MGGGNEQDASREAGEGRLGALLQDLALTHGRVQAAELLGVNYRTLVRSLESGQLSATMRQALERYVAELPDDGALPDALTTHDAPPADEDGIGDDDEGARFRQELAAWRAETAQALVRLGERLARLEQGGAGQHQTASATPRPEPPQARIYPQLVTTEPEQDEQRVYGAAMPLIAEWRGLRERLGRARHTLEYLQAEERLLELEIALADEHRLTLPPDSYPWDGIRRHAELRLRHRVLQRVRRERRWTQLLHWVIRWLSLGLWGRRRTRQSNGS